MSGDGSTSDRRDEEPSVGPIPAGIWRLNQDRSKLISPKALTLWIVKNDLQELAWVGVESAPGESVRIVTWRGRYDGSPGTCTGAELQARLTAAAVDGIRAEGEFPGIGQFTEVCSLADGGRRMICRGVVHTASGTQTYLEDFDWVGPSPHQALP